MATEMMPTLSPSLAIASKRCEPNRQSNWSRHLNQSKSIRLRRVTGTVFQWEPKVGASFNKCCRKQQQQQQATALDLDLGTQESDSHSHLNVPHQTHTAASFEMRAAQLGCGDLGRVSINHVGVDYDEDDDDQRSKQQATEATQAAANTSGIQNPMISSSVKSKSSSRPNSRQQQQEQEKHLKTTRIEREIATTKTTTTTSNRLTTSARGVRQRVLGVPLPMVAVMVASIVCGANLIGDCICDTNGGGNPFSGYRSAAAFAADNEYKEAAFSSGLPAANVAWRGPVTSSATIRRLSRAFKSEVQEGLQRQSRDPRIAARDDRRPTQASMAAATRKHHMDELLRSMAESIERQHADNLFISSASSTKIAKPSKFDSASQDDRRETSSPSITRHDEYLRDILASHERHPQQHQSKPTKSASSSGSSSGNHRSPTTSKADQELRQIMLMHEHAAPISSKTGKRNNMMMTDSDKSSSPEVSKQTSGKASKWVGAKLLSKLPKDLVSKANDLMSSVPDKVFSFAQQPQKLGILSAAAAKVAVSSQPSTSIATLTTTTTTTSSPFTPRANAKNYLMGPILGLGQMLMAQQQQPKPNLKPATVASRNPFSRHVVGPMMWAQSLQQQQSQPNYSQPANELRPATEPVSGSKSKKPSEQRRQETTSSEMLANAKLSNTPNSDNDDANKITSSSSSQLSSTNSKHQKITNGPRGNGGWLVDGATQLAQTYFKDSFRDLLTLSQLPIYSGGPVSTAPSDLEPGGKKWLANKQAAEQMRGNRTNAMEELLRYVYILGNVGVRRKRDPLKALGSGTPGPSYSSSSRPGVDRRRRPLLALLADNKPTITSLIKFHPPKSLAVSKLSSFLIPTNSDHINSRGVMWDMATDPTLAVTMFHLLERASVALPLGFLLMPFVHMVRHPFGGLNLGRILPARASHRSVDLEELAKRLDMVDKILSRSMRSTHRDASFMG